MNWINIHTEQTTAITDLLLAFLAGYVFLFLARYHIVDSAKTRIWRWALGLFVVAAFLGFVAHGFEMSDEINTLIWQPINLSLGLVIAFFVVGVVYDFWGERISKIATPVMILVGIGFYGITRLFPDTFLVFNLYEAVAMLFAMGVYVFLAVRRKFPGGWWMASAILVNIIAAIVQATKVVQFTLIWEFDHNGAFHIIQLVGVVLLLVGLSTSFKNNQV